LSRSARISIVLTVVRITPWQLQRRILLCMRSFSSTSFPCYANPLSSGVAVFFVLMWVMLTVQAYWVCEITQPGWKQVPGSICILPRAVPIAQIISGLLPFVTPSSVCLSVRFSATVISDSILVATPLMVRRISSASSLARAISHRQI